HHLRDGDRAARTARAGLLVPVTAARRVIGADRGRRRGLLRAHRRLLVRAVADPAVRQQRERGLRPADEDPGLLRPAQAVLILALALIVFLAYLTVKVIINDGIDVLVIISLIVLGILGFGVLGALGSSTDE